MYTPRNSKVTAFCSLAVYAISIAWLVTIVHIHGLIQHLHTYVGIISCQTGLFVVSRYLGIEH